MCTPLQRASNNIKSIQVFNNVRWTMIRFSHVIHHVFGEWLKIILNTFLMTMRRPLGRAWSAVDGCSPAAWSTLITLFISWSERITSSKTGMLPATKPVLPPWGTTARRRAWQWASTAETCVVDCGRSTIGPLPANRPTLSVHRRRHDLKAN